MATRRQEIEAVLEDREVSFDDLRELFEAPVHLLEEDLRHVDRSVRSRGVRLRVEPARCLDCAIDLRVRPGRYATPGRCPRCKGHHLAAPRLRVG